MTKIVQLRIFGSIRDDSLRSEEWKARWLFNITITSVPVIVALVVGGIEALGLLGEHFHLEGWFWETVAKLNDNFGTLGHFIVGLFALSWVVSIVFYKWHRFDDIELQARKELITL
jgi:high-affinity nickel permease